MNRPTRASLIVVLGAALAACSGFRTTGTPITNPSMTETSSASQPGSSEVTPSERATASESMEPTDALLAVQLRDVRSGETFTLGELAATSGPVLLEPMAVWCTNCRAQQHEVVRAHEAGDFASVSLDIDLSELPAELAAYADQEGFDWHFAMADVELYRALQDRFGVAVTNPPSTPLIIIGADGSVRPLEFGQGTRSAEELLSELGAA